MGSAISIYYEKHLGQNSLETNFAETNFPNAKTLI